MITYEQYVPGELKTIYDWRVRDWREVIVYNLGAKPVVVRPVDYDAAMKAERLPGPKQRGTNKTQYNGQPLVAALVEELLSDCTEPLTIDEIAQRIGRERSTVGSVLAAGGAFKKVGVRGVGVRASALWGPKSMPSLATPMRTQDLIAEVLQKHGALEAAQIARMIGKRRSAVGADLRKYKRFQRVGSRDNGGNRAILWALAEQEGSSGHD